MAGGVGDVVLATEDEHVHAVRFHLLDEAGVGHEVPVYGVISTVSRAGPVSKKAGTFS